MSKATFVVFGLTLCALAAPLRADNWEIKEELVHSATHSLDVDLTTSTVLCSQADYGFPHLKVLIPGLAKITLLNHQNTGAGAPCVAAGACQGPLMPGAVIDPNDPSETVSVTVQAFRINQIEHDAKTCSTYLSERISVEIRGIPFFHEESALLGDRPYGDCI